MKQISFFIIVIIAFMSVNCSSRQNTSSDKNNIVPIIDLPEKGEDTLKTSFIADTVIYIPLETKKESFIDNYIDQIWMDDSSILVKHSRQSDLFLFNYDGKYLRKIGKPGRGPGEYGNIFHFDVIRDTIYISSSGRRGFLRYTFDGNFCDEIKFNYQPVFFSTTEDQKLACYFPEMGKILVYNKNLHMPPDTITAEYGVTEGRYRYVPGKDKTMTYLQKHSRGLLFNDYRNDTIWNIAGYKKEPAFLINMKNKLPYDKQIEFCNGDLKGWSEIVTTYQFVHLIPFPSMMIIYQRHWRGNTHDAIYLLATKTGEIKKYNKPWIYDDILSRQRLWLFDYVYSNDYLIAIAYPPEESDYKKYKENSKAAPSPLWLDQMKNVKSDDNPLIVKIKLKKSIQ